MKHVKLKPVYGAAVALWIAQLTAWEWDKQHAWRLTPAWNYHLAISSIKKKKGYKFWQSPKNKTQNISKKHMLCPPYHIRMLRKSKYFITITLLSPCLSINQIK
jgi:hypothetical protein